MNALITIIQFIKIKNGVMISSQCHPVLIYKPADVQFFNWSRSNNEVQIEKLSASSRSDS